MSCSTLNNQSVGLNVAIGNLPEGFCPSSMQELAAAIAGRLIVTPNQGFFGFAIGSTEPASNVGPWLKNCEEIFVYDDSTARYVPLKTRGGFTNLEYHTASGTFIVPDFTTKLKVQGWGGGAGARFDGGAGAGGGGGGGYGLKIFDVTPGQSISYTIGAGGSGGAPGTDGGATIFLTMTCGGGKTSRAASFFGGDGGITTGATIPVNGASGDANIAGTNGGNGGDSPNGGAGGVFSDTSTHDGVTPGGGGAGGLGAEAAGNGAGGAITIEW